jgi:hypothetical protein
MPRAFLSSDSSPADARVCPIFFLLPSVTSWRVHINKFYFHSQRCNASHHPFTKGVYPLIHTLIYTLSSDGVSVSAVFFIRFNCPLTQHLFVCICIYLSLNTFCARCKLQWLQKDLAQSVHLYSNRCAFKSRSADATRSAVNCNMCNCKIAFIKQHAGFAR